MRYTPGITDRTELDVSGRTAKAFINVIDWVRIYNNSKIINLIVEFLNDQEIEFNEIETPVITKIPYVADLNTLLGNIERARVAACFPVIPGLVEIKDDWLSGSAPTTPTYLDANDWEKVMEVILQSFAAVLDYRVYCGVAATGQQRFYQNRWRIYPNWVQESVSPVRRNRTGIAVSGAGLTINNLGRRYD